MLPILKGTLAASGPWQSLFAKTGHRVYPYQSGCRVRGDTTSTTANVNGVGAFQANDYLMVCTETYYGEAALYIPDPTRFVKVSSVDATNKQLTLASATTMYAGEWLLNLGADATPNYSGSRVDLYSDPNGDSALGTKYLLTGQGGFYSGWAQQGTRIVDVLIQDGSGTPLVVQPQVDLAPGLGGLSYNVVDFGADPTGTDDSSGAFQAAIDAAEIVAGRVLIPAGDYVINTALTIDGKIAFEGEGVPDLRLDNLASGVGLTISSNSARGSRICGVRFVDTTLAKTKSGMEISTTSWITLKDVEFSGLGTGLILDSAHDSRGMTGLGFFYNATDLKFETTASTSIHFRDCRFEDASTAIVNDGGLALANISFIGCGFAPLLSAQGYTLDLGTGNGSIFNIVVAECRFEPNTTTPNSYNIRIGGQSNNIPTCGVVIRDNYFTGTVVTHITFDDYVKNPEIKGNFFLTEPSSYDVDASAITSIRFRPEVKDNVIYHARTTPQLKGNGLIRGGSATYDANVRNYGATGDGITDDAAAIQAAIEAAETVNGTVHLPVGTYLIGTTLSISEKITFRGAGRGDPTGDAAAATIIQKSADVLGILVEDGASYTVLEDFLLYAALGGDSTNGIEIGEATATNGVTQCEIRQVEVWSMGGDGIDVRNGNAGKMDNVFCVGNGGHGIRIDSDNTGSINVNAWTLINCSAGSNTGDGLSIVDGRDITVLGGDFESNGARGIYTNGPRNFIRSYAESNTGNDFECGSLALGGWFMVQASTVSLGTNKVMYIDQTTNYQSLYNDASNNWTIQEGSFSLAGPNADYDYVKWGMTQEDLTLSVAGATTDSVALLLPANSFIECVMAFVTTEIAGGGVTKFSVGDATTAARFILDYGTLTAGGKKSGLIHLNPTNTDAAGPVQSSAANVRVTCDATPTAGAVRLTVFYRTYVVEV